ncbi:glutaminase A [Aquabacterium sp. J223]|uniref:glutaminase A n=1 Tax=Aquabacterium sp. J223 TaxID=2898431 RepID=UPI0021AD6902|nr:glutaminase A [Aquabacterium sp. J223]UUX94747.1 glutaminase A [Aquabacterium sp. J223]
MTTPPCRLPLPDDAEAVLAELHRVHAPLTDGRVADYIPELAKVEAERFALALATVDGRVLAVGDADHRFTLQSLSKPFAFGLALTLCGRDTVHRRVGVEPTGDAFNSLVELEDGSHRPYNPMVNSGAMAVSALIAEAAGGEAWPRVQSLFDGFAGRSLSVDEAVFRSELATGHRNRAIAHLLKHHGVMAAEVEDLLALYLRQCALQVDVRDLARMGATLAAGGRQPQHGGTVLPQDLVRDLLSLMLTCGMYDSAGRWAYEVGLPAKSGVSGGVLAVVAGRFALAAWSPRLDGAGHSVRGIKALKALAQRWRLSLFDHHG